MEREAVVKNALGRFEKLLNEQLDRAEKIKEVKAFTDFSSLEKIVIGVCGGDGIGPYITKIAEDILKSLLKDEIEKGKVEIKTIEGLTLENRIAAGKAIPDDVLAALKGCDVILKGPTTTPRAGDGNINLESANVAMRRELDLFANLRPVKIPEWDVDWTFFRENTEGAYAVGSKGIRVSDDLSVDFTVTTTEGTERLARLAFEYAKNNGYDRVTIVTKANVIKATDGKFLSICQEVAKEYPSITVDDWYIDIMTAKLVDPKRRSDFKVVILPNLYGDIITDEAAELQGGVGTAGSANIGKKYGMFEAIHGSAPRMVQEGRADYADPSSIIKAASMLLSHIGMQEKAAKLEKALDKALEGCNMTGRADGCTNKELGQRIIELL